MSASTTWSDHAPRVDRPASTELPITVSPMRARHLREVAAIEQQVYPTPWSVRLFEEELDRRNRVYLVARMGPTVVGYAGLLLIAPEGHVSTVAVHPDWQGRGIARRLLLELVRGALDLQAESLTLEVRVSNEPAKALYRRFGFAPAGIRPRYYGDNNEDALIMWVHEADGAAYAQRLAEIEASLPSPTIRQGFSAPSPRTAHPAVSSQPEDQA